MQKKYSHIKTVPTSLPCPLLWPCIACLARTRQWVLDGEFIHCPTGLRRRYRDIYSAFCGKNGTFPEPLALASVRRLNVKPRRYEKSGWEVGKIERSSELAGLARASLLPLLILLMYVYSSKVVGAVGWGSMDKGMPLEKACPYKRYRIAV